MERVLTTNRLKAKRVTQGGRVYRVAHVTMVVPGVLPGSNGPLYFPADELARNASDWDGIPIVVYHPMKDGSPVSAYTPGMMEAVMVGDVRGARTDRKGRLGAEAWLDEEWMTTVDLRVMDAVDNGRPVEVSTGLIVTHYEDAKPGSVDGKGMAYGRIARGYVPDHLALLPDQVGACSLANGCGLLMNVVKYGPAATMDMDHYLSGRLLAGAMRGV